MKDIFYEFIREASTGEVFLDDPIPWPCGFYTYIYRGGKEIKYKDGKEFYDNGEYSDEIDKINSAVLIIKDENSFFDLLEQYVNLEIDMNRKYYNIYVDPIKNKIKAIILNLFVNANTEEFLNPEDLIRRKISFLNDDTFSYLDDEKELVLEDFILDGNVRIKRSEQPLTMETPYKIEIGLVNRNSINEVDCPLVDISYGICEDDGEKVCYVYSIMKPKEQKNTNDAKKSYQKKINRILYQLNEGVIEQESEAYIAYKNGKNDYYPENISDVTHGFVFSLSIFMALLQKEGITKVKVVPYLPIRYFGRDFAASKETDIVRRSELKERNDKIQSNATEKFLRTFRRVAYHMGNAMELWGLPYEQDEFLTYKVHEKKEALNNDILDKISNGVLDLEKEKRL